MKITANQVLKMDDREISRMGAEELKAAIRSFQKSVSQRVKRLHKAGIYDSPAETYLKKSGGSPKTTKNGKPMTANQMRNEISRMRRLFEYETFTVKGYREVQKKFADRMSGAGYDYDEWPPEYQAKMWDAYNRYIEMYPEDLVRGQDQSSRIQQSIIRIMREDPTLDVDDIIDRAHGVVGNYEQDVNTDIWGDIFGM